MVDVVKYTPAYKDTIKAWLIDRGLDGDAVESYPDRAWVAIHGHHLIAAAGLCFDRPIACLFGLVTNPKEDSFVRSRSIDVLTQKIIDESKKLGAEKLIAWTSHESIVKRSHEHGFKEIDEKFIGIDLGE